MAELDRLKRVFDSWLGNMRKRKKRRVNVYNDDDALLIITDLGMKTSAEVLTYMTDNTTRMADFLMQIYAAEDELNVDLVQDNVRIDPRWNPNIYQEDGKVVFTAEIEGEEYLIAEFDFPAQ